MSATLRQIADEAKVSLTTVSHVLNGTAGHIKISPETERRVSGIAKRLNYTPNIMAKALRSGRSSLIGVILGALDRLPSMRLFQGLEDFATERNYGVIVRTTGGSAEQEVGSVQFLLDKKVDGLIIASALFIDPKAREGLEKLKKGKIPAIFAGENPDPPLDVHFHGFDNRLVGLMATRRLLKLGHRRILCLTNTLNKNLVGILRVKGYREALAEAGVEFDPGLLLDMNPAVSYSEAGYAAMRGFLKGGRDFSAVFIHSSEAAFGAMRALKEAGLSVPEDVSIICEGDDEYVAHATPSLTSVRLDNYRLGRMLAEKLIAKVEGKSVREPALEPVIVERESCGKPPRNVRQTKP